MQTIKRGLGAKLSAPDHRRIQLARVQAPVKRPKQYYFDDSKIPTEDQLQNGSCVGQAEGGEIECRELKDTKKVTPVSKRWIYAQCKKIDGYNGEGTYPTVAANLKVQKGAPTKDFCEDNNKLKHSDYIIVPEDSLELKEDASIRVAEGYAYVNPFLEDMLQAIYQNGTYTVSLQVGNWNEMPLKPTPSRGWHRVRFNGYREIDGDAILWFRNSWGNSWSRVKSGFTLNAEEKEKIKRGDGFILFSEYQNYIQEQIVYTDIPYALIMEARGKKYIFMQDLQYRDTGTDVMELQKRLAKEIAKDGKPCYRYPTATNQSYTNYFGRNTEDAVKRYQVMKNIAKSGVAGYGRLGPKTRLSLNAPAGATSPLGSVKKIIVVNAGHSDVDPGAVTLKEADEAKAIRNAFVELMKSAGFTIHQVPDGLDLVKSIAWANTKAKALNDALLIDIHLNYSHDKKARGVEAYHGTSAISKLIADTMAKKIAESLGMKNRGGKPDTQTAVGSLGWIRQTKAWATLVEVGFISSPEDMAILRSPAGYKAAAQGIANAIFELYGVDAPPEPTKPGVPEAKKLIQQALDILNEV